MDVVGLDGYLARLYSWVRLVVCTGILTNRIKMVGLFAFATIGLATIMDLWERLDVERGLTMVHHRVSAKLTR